MTNSALAAAEFNSLFDAFEKTVVRLEALPSYAVGGAEEERLRAWRTGLPRPERNVRRDPWLARIAISTVSGGKSWARVRVVDEPLTDYQRYQLVSYGESQAVGERISLVARGAAGEVGDDFWLFDRGSDRAHVVLMHYHDDGRVDRRELVEDPATVAALSARLACIEDVAVPLNVFLASLTVVGG